MDMESSNENESSDSVTFVDSSGSIVKEERGIVLDNFHNAICDSKLKTEFFSAETEMEYENEMKYENSSFNRSSIAYSPSYKEDTSACERLPFIFNGTYFKVVKRIEDTDHQKKARGILARCNFCSDKIIKGSLNITSNFIQHLKKLHRIKYEEYLKAKNDIGKMPRTRRSFVSSSSPSSTPMPTPNQQPPPPPPPLSMNQTITEFDEIVLTMIVDNALSPSILESESFRNLVQFCGSVAPSKPHLKNLLDIKHSKIVANLRKSLAEIQHLCTTLNVWLWRRKFIFGYTCHWINKDYTRKSAALGYRSFNVDESSLKIPDYLQRINFEFGITDDRIVKTITNNEDCVINAFKEFGLKDYYEYGDGDSEDEEDEQARMMTDLSNCCQQFPNHSQCVIQNLCEFATTDFISLLKLNSSLHQLHRTTFKRCSMIWSKCGSEEYSETVKNFVGFSLKVPSSTDWLTLYESLKCLLSLKDKLNHLCNFLEVQAFDYVEIEYLDEYCQLMAPIADAFKFLQTESQMFYGYFLPTLVTIKVKLYKLDFDSFKYLTTLGRQMENKFFKRFQNFFELQSECIDAVVAAVSCPIIKLKFVKALIQFVPKVSMEEIRLHFFNYAREFQVDLVDDKTQLRGTEVQDTSIDHEFFDFGHCSTANVKQEVDPLTHIRREFDRYLADEDSSLTSLDEYPIVKKVFIKYNTPLPSYASVRRLFAYSGVTSSKRHLKRSTRLFERHVFMKANEVLF